MGRHESMILSTSDLTTILSMDIQMLNLFIANDMICTFSRSSQTNSTLPSFLSKKDSRSVLMAIWENW